MNFFNELEFKTQIHSDKLLEAIRFSASQNSAQSIGLVNNTNGSNSIVNQRNDSNVSDRSSIN